MDTLDAQCLLVRTLGDCVVPDTWLHDRAGSLTCAYAGGERTFTWPPHDVTEMARKWRGGDAIAPEAIEPFVEAHKRIVQLVEQGGLSPADAIVHDVQRAELRLLWHDEKLVVIIDDLLGATSGI